MSIIQILIKNIFRINLLVLLQQIKFFLIIKILNRNKKSKRGKIINQLKNNLNNKFKIIKMIFITLIFKFKLAQIKNM